MQNIEFSFLNWKADNYPLCQKRFQKSEIKLEDHQPLHLLIQVELFGLSLKELYMKIENNILATDITGKL